MTDTHIETLRAIARRGSLGTIVHVGAGNGKELEALSELAPVRAVLIEPDGERASDLARRTADLPWAEVIEAALADTAGTAAFHRLNFRSLSGLSQPEGLTDLFPGLRATDSFDVDTLDMAAVLQRAGLSTQTPQEPVQSDNDDKTGIHVLILDAVSASGAVITALAAPGTPDGSPPVPVFAHILVSAPVQPFWGAGSAVKGLLDTLSELGYRIATEQTVDPDFPRYWLSLDPLAHENQRLVQALAASRTEVAQMEQTLADMAQQIAQAESQAPEAEAISTLETRLDEMKKSRDAAQKTANEAREQTQNARSDLTAALQMQMLARADLNDLKDRYRTLHAENTAQAELLGQLSAQLEIVAQHLSQTDTAEVPAATDAS